jgi:hypothetical protein
MGDLTEIEIFDCIGANAKLAAEHCDDLAKKPREGETYDLLRTELKLIEGACRQASAWRGDTRWLPIGLQMEQAHQAAGDWLRGCKVCGQRIRLAERHNFHCFTKLAENLRALHAGMIKLRDAKTSRVGMILPDTQAAPLRDTRPVGFRKSQGGLILPGSAALQ